MGGALTRETREMWNKTDGHPHPKTDNSEGYPLFTLYDGGTGLIS